MRLKSIVALVAVASSLTARAEVVTEGAFLAAIDGEHPAVRALGEGLARAEAARRRAGTLANPRFEFWREQPDANPRLTNWTVAWTPPLDGRFGLGKRAAAAGVAAARERLAAERARLRAELRRVFAEWSLGHERHALLARRLDQVAGLAEQERQRARVGTESGLSARRLTLAEAEARAALREAEAALVRAEAQARAWQPDLPRDASPAPPLLLAPPDAADPSASPALRALGHDLQQVQLESRMAGRFWGFPTLQMGVQRLETAGVVQTGPLFGAGWSIPLFDRDHGRRAEALRLSEIAAARLKQAQALVAGEVHGALEAYRSLFASAREAAEASAETDRVIAAATAAYLAGETSLTDLLDALRAAFEARLRTVDVRGQALAAHRNLEAALGRALPDGGVR